MSGRQVLNPARHEINLHVDLATGKDEMPGTFVNRLFIKSLFLKSFPQDFWKRLFLFQNVEFSFGLEPNIKQIIIDTQPIEKYI